MLTSFLTHPALIGAVTLLSGISLLEEYDPENPPFDPNKVTPGWTGVLFTTALVAVVLVVGILMVRKIRRINYRSQVRESLAAEKEAAERAAQQPNSGNPDARGEGN